MATAASRLTSCAAHSPLAYLYRISSISSGSLSWRGLCGSWGVLGVVGLDGANCCFCAVKGRVSSCRALLGRSLERSSLIEAVEGRGQPAAAVVAAAAAAVAAPLVVSTRGGGAPVGVSLLAGADMGLGSHGEVTDGAVLAFMSWFLVLLLLRFFCLLVDRGWNGRFGSGCQGDLMVASSFLLGFLCLVCVSAAGFHAHFVPVERAWTAAIFLLLLASFSVILCLALSSHLFLIRNGSLQMSAADS